MERIGVMKPAGILISGDQVGTVTGEVIVPAGSGKRLAGTLLSLGADEKCPPLADGGTPYAVLSQDVDARTQDAAAIGYFTGQYTESVIKEANPGLDVEAVRGKLRLLNIHIQSDTA